MTTLLQNDHRRRNFVFYTKKKILLNLFIDITIFLHKMSYRRFFGSVQIQRVTKLGYVINDIISIHKLFVYKKLNDKYTTNRRG